MICCLELHHEKRNNRWNGLYQCRCGNQFVSDNSKVKRGKTKSCGCARKTWLSGPGQKWNEDKKLKGIDKENATKKQLEKIYKYKCDKEGIPWELTFEEFCEFLPNDCNYCGRSKVNSYEGFRYNGLDRIYPDGNYRTSNIVSCCKDCNYMKRRMGYDEFIQHCKLIAERFTK